MSPEFLSQIPALNAGLNATATVLLLIAGYAIKVNKNEGLHKKTMMAAFTVSAVFLGFYLTYHFQVGHVEFKGEGPIRIVYFTLLIPHVILAVAVLPLILLAIRHALLDHRPQHLALVKWAYPIWLFVAISGVIIYFMVFHLYA